MTAAIKVGVLSCAIAAALFFAWWGGAVALTVFDDYKDSKDSTYLFFGGMMLIFAAFVVVATLASGLPQHMSRSQLLLSMPIGVVLLAGILAYLYYGPPSEPPGPDYHRSTRQEIGAPGIGPGMATPSVGTPLPQR